MDGKFTFTAVLVGVSVIFLNQYFPLLATLALCLYIGRQILLDEDILRRNFDLLVAVCVIVWIFSIFSYTPPALSTVAAFGLLLGILRLVLYIPGFSFSRAVTEPQLGMAASAIQAKSIMALITSLVNVPALLAVAGLGLLIIPLVALDLLLALFSIETSALLVSIGMVSLTVCAVGFNIVDGLTLMTRKVSSMFSSETEEWANTLSFPRDAAIMIYSELDAELPRFAESNWTVSEIESLSSDELVSYFSSSFREEVGDEEVDFELLNEFLGQETDYLATAEMSDLDLRVALALVSTEGLGKEPVDEALNVLREDISGLDPQDLFLLAIPTEIEEEVKLTILSEFGIVILDSKSLARDFHEQDLSPDQTPPFPEELPEIATPEELAGEL